jgi:hypothetical protein
MKHDPIVLDEHRGMAAQQATEIRRRLAEVEADQEALRERRTDLEKFLLAAPASTWPEAADKARYLIGLLATTSLARDPRRRKLIAGVLDDFCRLLSQMSPARWSADVRRLHFRQRSAARQDCVILRLLLAHSVPARFSLDDSIR